MKFYYDKSWNIEVSTAVGKIKLLVDTGASFTSLSVFSLSKLLNTDCEYLKSVLVSKGSITCKTISNHTIKLYPLVLPKILVGDSLFPEFNCLVSLDENFISVLGRDVLQCGITTLQFKQLGQCSPFDYSLYREQFKDRPVNTLAFLDYT